MNRRRFLLLSGATLSGLLLPAKGLFTLSRKFIVDLNGACSFCGKRSHEVFGLAGVGGIPTRICDECIHLCLDIVADEIQPPELDMEAPPLNQTDSFEELLAQLEAQGVDTEPLRAALTITSEEIRREVGPPPKPVLDLSCSFCRKNQKEVQKLIAGPSVYACDECVFEASALFTQARAIRA